MESPQEIVVVVLVPFYKSTPKDDAIAKYINKDVIRKINNDTALLKDDIINIDKYEPPKKKIRVSSIDNSDIENNNKDIL